MRTLLAAGLLALVVPACIVGPGEITGTGEEAENGEGGSDTGGGGGGGGGTTTTARLQASVDKATISTELGKTETLVLTIQSMDGFAGSVPVTPVMEQGYTVTATPSTVTLTAGGSATVNVEVKIPTDAASLSPQLKLDLGGSSPTSVTSALTVANKYTVMIPAGTGTGAHNGIPRTAVSLRSGATLVFHNSDGIQHVVHGDMGVPHEDTTAGGMPNSDYMITVSNDGTWYCHSHEGGTQARIVNVL
jgi:hypothetical protein